MARRLTHSALFAFILDRLDEAGSPRWDAPQVARVFNAVYGDWLRSECERDLEKNEAARRELGPLTLTTPALPLTGRTLDLDALEPSLYRVVAVAAEWERTLSDRVTGRTRRRLDAWPVSPIRHDQKALAQTDPWNAPADETARYSETCTVVTGDTERPVKLTIHCTTQPARLTLDYVQEPKAVDFQGDPDGKTEVGYDVQIELCRRTVAILATTDENFPAAQAGYQELQIAN